MRLNAGEIASPAFAFVRMKYKNPPYKVFSKLDNRDRVDGPYILQADGSVVLDPSTNGLGAYSQYNSANRHVACTNLRFTANAADEHIRVSTVFLCIDHRHSGAAGHKLPILFETVVFGNASSAYEVCKRTSGGVHQALRMHMRELSNVLAAHDIHIVDTETLFQISATPWYHNAYWRNIFRFKRKVKKRNRTNGKRE